jgi:biopolymer transport protein ExbB
MELLLFIRDHFMHAGPVLFAGLLGVAIIIERYRALSFTYPMKNTKAFFDKIADAITRNDTTSAVALCDEHIDKPVARVVKTALQRAHLPEQAIEQGVNITLNEVRELVQKRTPFLATIANVSTLLGLFGTIVGLIQSFQAVADADPEQKSALLSAGISTSMNATMLGLGVAIPAMIAFAFLMNKSNKLHSELDDAALKTMDLLKLRYFQPAARGPATEVRDNGRVA